MNTQALQALGAQQQALLQALLARPGSADAHACEERLAGFIDASQPQTARGLAVYRANGHAMAERALRSAYPVVAQLIGVDNFALLARDLWHSHPPLCGDLAQWGTALPSFLQTSEQLADTPYLSDVARAEWALHRAAGAPDAEPDLPSFARLGQDDPHGLALTLPPGTTVIRSPYPVASLITAHLSEAPSLAEAAQRLRERCAEHALVWRHGWRPRIAAIEPPAADLVEALLAGADLPQALDAACAGADPGADSGVFDFSAWLTAAVTDGLVIGVHNTISKDNTP